uniref:Uncharacterized protein n=1 Tax=Anopheles culicifacies TaxID=139723 RepID=A0A182MMG1_9DIPT
MSLASQPSSSPTNHQSNYATFDEFLLPTDHRQRPADRKRWGGFFGLHDWFQKPARNWCVSALFLLFAIYQHFIRLNASCTGVRCERIRCTIHIAVLTTTGQYIDKAICQVQMLTLNG